MAIRRIRLLGDPVLREPAAEVTAFGPELHELVADMFETMAHADGAGLAATQVGVSERVFVADVRRDAGPEGRVALVNPRIVEASEETDREPEGCLSIPGVSDVVARPSRVTVEGLDPDGRPVRVSGSGLLARVLQHEIDHLDGVLFIDHLSPLKRRLLLGKYRRLAEDE
jgi:peptide deformylase